MRRNGKFSGSGDQAGPCPSIVAPADFRIVPDPVLTLAVISRCCGGVLYGSRTPELDYTRLTGTALAFDDPFLRDLCFPNPPPSES